MNLGATVMSQSLLSDAVSWLAYGWGRGGGSMLRGGMTYSGLGAVLDVDFTWGGGPQLLYTAIPPEAMGTDIMSGGLKHHVGVSTRLSLPMTLTSGRWFSSLTPSVEFHYNNGLIFKYVDQQTGKLTRGVERLSLSLRYSGQTRMALSEILPRWGVSARAGYVVNPTNDDFRDLWTASLGVWLPGVVRPHSTRIRLAWQQTEDNGAPFGYQVKEVFPRGARYNFSARSWQSASLDYQLPVWYPEAGIPGVLYFKRVRLNLFADLARWRDFGNAGTTGGMSMTIVSGTPWHKLWSWGGDLIIDMSPLRLPATNHFSATFTLARPSDRHGLFFNFGLELPL